MFADSLQTGAVRASVAVSGYAQFRLMSEPLALDLYPSKTSSFHLSLGALIN